MKLADILELTGAAKKTVYRWMDRHPSITAEDTKSLLGHPFPRPHHKVGREVIWDDSEVHAWWQANAKTVGRYPEDTPTTTMSWTSFRRMTQEAIEAGDEDNPQRDGDDLLLVQSYERQGDNVRLWFRNVSDAVYFKLKWA